MVAAFFFVAGAAADKVTTDEVPNQQCTTELVYVGDDPSPFPSKI